MPAPKKYDAEAQERAVRMYRDRIREHGGPKVWHCSLSLKADEGELTDEQWNTIATEFMDEMGFTDTSGRSPTRRPPRSVGERQRSHPHRRICGA
ncbi:hypothetical protein R3Q06_31205 [Rhodococcus erythropolis]|uniref:relaxase/mobilization nuclease domain-containing protein n=1 Tax=Rhodococcus erythropolis TaxID=1833 RepID=UPI0029490487|nr:hypothetical protein [Rhodococcus erythropolis]MDV6277953.1 hypothetical protein [Rhodococcus erythropolis]